MDRAFGLLGFLNIIALSMGGLLGFVPPMLVANFGFSTQTSYWITIVVAMAFYSARMPLYLLSARTVAESRSANLPRFSLRSKGVVARFAILTVMGQVGYSVLFSLFPFYANRKFGIESDALGTLFFASWLVSALSNIAAARISSRLGTLKTISVSFALSSPFYLLISLAPSFSWASAPFLIRMGIANVASPLTSSLFMRLLQAEEKSTANSVNMMASMGGSALATWLGGQLMESASIDLPVYIGSGLYLLYAASYYFLLKNNGSS